jgi:enoyl-CoA hydratase
MNPAKHLEVEVVGTVNVISIARPEKLNAWNRPMRAGIGDLLSAINAQPEVSAVVLTGQGSRAFCAGADLTEILDMRLPAQVKAALDEWRVFYDHILGFHKPLVVALNGLAAGSGFQVALMGDVRVAHVGVTMGQTEIKSGIPSITGSTLMARRLGTAVAAELALSGRMMPADEAVRLGLINHLVDACEVRSHAIAIAQELGSRSAHAVRLTKQWLHQAEREALAEAFDFAWRAQSSALEQGEMARLVSAFVHKTPEAR